jgi:hypothetical protein
LLAIPGDSDQQQAPEQPLFQPKWVEPESVVVAVVVQSAFALAVVVVTWLAEMPGAVQPWYPELMVLHRAYKTSLLADSDNHTWDRSTQPPESLKRKAELLHGHCYCSRTPLNVPEQLTVSVWPE